MVDTLVDWDTPVKPKHGWLSIFFYQLLRYVMAEGERKVRMSIDTGMVVVIFLSLMYMVLVFGLLFYVKNDWCDLLFKNNTV